MKRAFIIGFVIVFVILALSIAYAHRDDTPYGDYCSKCGKYGICPEFLSIEESRDAVEGYFSGKNIKVGNMRGRGRFLKIDLIKEKKLHDVILFDRKTGRIRSIY